MLKFALNTKQKMIHEKTPIYIHGKQTETRSYDNKIKQVRPNIICRLKKGHLQKLKIVY